MTIRERRLVAGRTILPIVSTRINTFVQSLSAKLQDQYSGLKFLGIFWYLSFCVLAFGYG